MTREPPAGTLTLVGNTHLRGSPGSSLRLKSDKWATLVEGLNNSTQSERSPLLLVSDWLLARTSFSTTEALEELTTMLVTELTALNAMPNTSSLLVPPPQQVT